MPDDKSPSSNNPFIRFKHHVDANVHAGLNSISNNFSRSSSTPDNNNNNSNNSQPSSSSYPSPFATPDMPPSPSSTSTDLTPMNMLYPAETHLESRIDLLRGGTAAESHLAWRLFLTRSAYSPLRLARELPGGWHPTPRDLPPPASEWESSSNGEFGWLEAFEDLLRVQSGLGLADLQKRRRDRCGEEGGWFGWRSVPGGGWGWHGHGHGMVGFWGGAPGWGMREMAWLERMSSRGLTEALFPVYDPGLGYQSPRTREEWAERRRVEQEKEAQAGRMWEEFFAERKREMEEMEEAEREVRRLANAWADEARREMRREVDAGADEARDKGTSFFDGLGGIVRTLGKVLEDEVKSLQRYGKGERKDETAVEKKQDTSAPETEGDLYSVIQSAFQESERSLSNFFKSISEGWRDGSLAEPKPASPPKTETTEVVENGVTKKTTKKEFVDKHGNTHSKIETTWTDEDGRVIMRQVHSSMGRSQHWEKTIESEPSEQAEETVNVVKEEKKEGGWFWK
ncbi:hypothetical protein C8A03DRAFT_29372 [Achaetomium macrosporum]|uniref:Uncharacterized protein n=1 Tax=Achaetomium macrosporum TaxID=79813 RepID=A0AAN7CIV2_9PEZI|nr:hypothetical protein C8A03DRAFT_29372 [Achaetomium macrosporum]